MCYIAPVIGAVVTSGVWSKTRNVKVWWLTLMFYAGALVWIIDHLWNSELFLISENIVSDLLLGVVVVAVILIAWGITAIYSKVNPTLANYVNVKS